MYAGIVVDFMDIFFITFPKKPPAIRYRWVGGVCAMRAFISISKPVGLV